MNLISPRFHFLRCFLVLILSILAMLSACIKSPSAPPTQIPSVITLSSVKVVITSIGQWVLITATVLDKDSKVITNATIHWKSENESIATVSNRGLVTAVSGGTAQIAVTSGYATAGVSVTVILEVGSIKITPASATLTRAGVTVQLEAVVYDNGNSAISGAKVVWSSSDPAVATVDANGLVTAVSRGETQITATSGEVSTSSPVFVVIPQLPVSIELNISQVTLTSIGQSVQLDAEVYGIEGVAIPVAGVRWSSSRSSVATVSGNGLVIAVSNGFTQITAASGGVSMFATISVVIEGTVPPPDPSINREALVAFYNATGGPNWANNTNWLSNKLFGEWYGVTTDKYEQVAELRLIKNNLSGHIPPEIGQLQNLEILHLPNNRLIGSIPPEVGQLSNLRYLSFYSNQLIGEIPPEILQLHSLFSLILVRQSTIW